MAVVTTNLNNIRKISGEQNTYSLKVIMCFVSRMKK